MESKLDEIYQIASRPLLPFSSIRRRRNASNKRKWDDNDLDTRGNENMVDCRNDDGTITNKFEYSEKMNRLRAPQRPFGHKQNLWSGIDVWAYHRKNNPIMHVTGIFMAVVSTHDYPSTAETYHAYHV